MLGRALIVLLLTITALGAQTTARPIRDLSPGMIISTRVGMVRNVVRYAPIAPIPSEQLAHCSIGPGLFAIDLDYRSGFPDGVRAVQSTGCSALDSMVRANLRQWVFQPPF